MKRITISLSEENCDSIKKGNTILIFCPEYVIQVERD